MARARQRWTQEFATRNQHDASGEYRSATFYRADDLKYNRIRIDERFAEDPDKNPGAKPLKQVAYVADHILVRFEDEQKGLVDGILARFPELSVRHELATGNHVLLQFPLPDYEIDYFSYWSRRLEARGLTAEKDRLAFATANIPPADPDYANQWALDNTGQTGGTEDADIDADLAWEIETGSSDVVVAVIDTGVDLNHIDLLPNLWVASTGNSQIRGYNAVADNFTPEDGNGHGTHVAGVIGASTDNYRGMAGLNWDVSIMPVKVLNDEQGEGFLSDIVAGVNFAIAHGASIINMSLGVSGEDIDSDNDSLLLELTKARDTGEGILVVASAGNDGANADQTPTYPAAYKLSNIISVAASDHNDDLASSSNFGKQSVDLAAPGVDILSTLPDDAYGQKTGTSMAAPHVAGVAALIKAHDSSYNYLDLKNLILDSVDQIASHKDLTATGGRLNANNALLSFTGPNALITSLNLKPLGGPDNNGDEFLTLGETMLIDVAIHNLGSATATDVSLDLEILQGEAYVALTGPASIPLSAIGPDGSVVKENAFELSADNFDIFDFSQSAEIKITLHYNGRTHVKYASYEIFQNASLSGYIYDGVDGVTPIEGALVKVNVRSDAGVFEWTTLTDASGYYSFELLTSLVAVTVSADGYVTSVPDVIDLTPGNPDQTKDYELGQYGFSVLTPNIDVTIPAGEQLSLDAEILNTGTSKNSLPLSIDYSEGGIVLSGDQLYGLAGIGTRAPRILLLDELSFLVRETVDLSLPEGKYALDLTYLNGNIWILTHNADGTASVFAFNVESWNLVDSVDLDIRNTENFKSVEALLTVSYPDPVAEDPDARRDVLAVVMAHRYLDERVYRINPDTDSEAGLTENLGNIDVFYSGFWYTSVNMSATGAKGRDSLFVSEDHWFYEFTLNDETGLIGENRTEYWIGDFQTYTFTPDFFYRVNFPYAEIESITYFEANSSLYLFTDASFRNVIRLDLDAPSGEDDQPTAVIDIFDAPRELDRLTSSSSTFDARWLSLGFDNGSVARGETLSLPVQLDTTDLVESQTKFATIRVRAPLVKEAQFITVNLTVGNVAQLPGFARWYQKHYLADPGPAAFSSDTDGDSVEAAIEYVVGGDPTENDNANGGLPSVVFDPSTNDVFMKFRKRIDLPGDILVIKGAETLSDPMVELVEGVDYTLVSKTPVDNEIEEILISTPFTGSGFFSLEINL